MASRRARGNRVRIIAGTWRGRWLNFPDIEGLRPTPDRVRETLFNWLAPLLPGAHCLDLFAGSGALGVEALSRGAVEVCFVERHPRAVRALEDNLQRLGAQGARVERADALAWLREASPRAWDVVLLDPPFGRGCLAPVCAALQSGGWLAPGAHVYLESERGEGDPPGSWTVLRERTAGQVRYRLARWEGFEGG